jgi:hypothetical protein
MRIRLSSGLEANVFKSGETVICQYDDGDKMIVSADTFAKMSALGDLCILDDSHGPEDERVAEQILARIHEEASRILAEG